MSESPVATPHMWVSPYRFSSNPQAMIEFLQLCGLSPVVTGNGFAVLRADAGEVGVHGATDTVTGSTPGQTQLVLGTTDAEAAADALRRHGYEAVTWDESYGRHAGVVDAHGGGIWINEEQRDLYGYQGHVATPTAGCGVVAVRYSTDFDADRQLFGALGFRPDGPGDEWWQALSTGPRSGHIGLHHNTGEAVAVPGNYPLGANSVCDLSLATSLPLEQLRDRLVDAGHPAEVRQLEGLGPVLCVTDPDGVALQVHPAS